MSWKSKRKKKTHTHEQTTHWYLHSSSTIIFFSSPFFFLFIAFHDLICLFPSLNHHYYFYYSPFANVPSLAHPNWFRSMQLRVFISISIHLLRIISYNTYLYIDPYMLCIFVSRNRDEKEEWCMVCPQHISTEQHTEVCLIHLFALECIYEFEAENRMFTKKNLVIENGLTMEQKIPYRW